MQLEAKLEAKTGGKNWRPKLEASFSEVISLTSTKFYKQCFVISYYSVVYVLLLVTNNDNLLKRLFL